jgi:molybdopterin/thiamine biosynthesis adenylyltransferase
MNQRYAKQILLKDLGAEGQQKLAGASVLIVGCGALGSVQSQLLVRAGVGRVRIVDRDVPEIGNLHRQILFDEDDVQARSPKADVAARRLARVNSSVILDARVMEVTAGNIDALVSDMDLVLDATDNFETRYLINDACVRSRKPWIYGGVIATSGMSMTIVPGRGPCLRCLFPEPPEPGTVPTIRTEGVLATAPVTVAALEVTEAIKLLCGAQPREGLLMLDVWTGSFQSVPVLRDENCPACGQVK